MDTPIETELLESAIHYAVVAHAGQMRKADKVPSIIHSLEATVIASTMTSDLKVLSAVVLHDTVEDAAITMENIKSKFGDRIAELVASETEDKRPNIPSADSWRIRKEESMEILKNTKDRDVKILYLSDKLSNMRSFYRLKLTNGDKMFNMFNQKDPEQHHWYYRTIADLIKDELGDTPAYKEYDQYIKLVFNEGE